MAKKLLRESRGSVLVLAAMTIVLALGFMTLGVDLLHVYLVKNELQRAADAGALAAVKALTIVGPGAAVVTNVSPDCTVAFNVCQAVVAANPAEGASMQILANDIVFGRWDVNTRTFNPIGCAVPKQVDAVQVTVRKDQEANGPVSLFFGGFLPGGWSSINLTARAIGLAGYAGSAPAGAGVFPLAIDQNKVPPGQPGEPINFHFGSGTGGACWQSFFNTSAAASELKALVNGSAPSPAVKVGDAIRVSQGTDDAVIQEVERIFNHKAAAGQDWVVLAPVISGETHTGTTAVQGFVAFKFTAVQASGGDKYLSGVTVPYCLAPTLSLGGPNFGLRAGMPKLVQ